MQKNAYEEFDVIQLSNKKAPENQGLLFCGGERHKLERFLRTFKANNQMYLVNPKV